MVVMVVGEGLDLYQSNAHQQQYLNGEAAVFGKLGLDWPVVIVI